jgi:hypothetical protein
MRHILAEYFIITLTMIAIKILCMYKFLVPGVFFSNAFDSVPSAIAYLVPFDYLLMVTSGMFIKLR